MVGQNGPHLHRHTLGPSIGSNNLVPYTRTRTRLSNVCQVRLQLVPVVHGNTEVAMGARGGAIGHAQGQTSPKVVWGQVLSSPRAQETHLPTRVPRTTSGGEQQGCSASRARAVYVGVASEDHDGHAAAALRRLRSARALLVRHFPAARRVAAVRVQAPKGSSRALRDGRMKRDERVVRGAGPSAWLAVWMGF
jgi:hypothetical protein